MNVETGLISCIKSKEDFLHVLDERISKAFFEEHGEIFQAIADHYGKYDAVPERETLKKAFPNFSFYEGSEPLNFFVDMLKEQYKKKIYTQGLAEVAPLLAKDVHEAERKLQKLVVTAKDLIKSGTDLDIRLGAELEMAEYEKRAAALGVDGFSTSWPYLDDLTCGYHEEELIVIMAKAKMGKSWLITWKAQHIWREYNVPCLVLTKEMGVKAIRRRFRAIDMKLPYDSLRRGILTKDQKKQYEAYLAEMEKDANLAPFVVLGHDLTDGTSGVSSIIPKIERYLPNGGVLFVDGIYLIPDDRGEKDWKAITNVAMDLKILAQRYKIPIIATTQYSMQSKADRPHLEGAAYGKYVVQYADLVLALSRDDVDLQADRGKIHVLGQREGDTGEFSINMRFDPIDFSQRNDKSISDDDESDEEVLKV